MKSPKRWQDTSQRVRDCAIAVVAVCAMSGCVGRIGDMGAAGTTPVLPPNGHVDRNVGPSPMRRLNRAEYNNTVHDLFGSTSSPASGWPADGADSGFDNDVNAQGPTDDLIEQVMRSAEQVATEATAHLATLLPCSSDASVSATTCGNQFIETFGRRTYRRSLTDDDRTRLRAVLAWGIGRGGLATGVRLVITAMLQSPHFLYRPEFGSPSLDANAAAGTVALDDIEIASRLSYLLLASSPDDALLTAAESHQLHTPEQLRTQAERLLDSAAGRRTLDHFFEQWLPFGRLATAVKSPTEYPTFDDATRTAMADGLRAFVQHVVFDSQRGGLDELFTANYAFVERHTAPLYGLSGAFGDTLQQVTLREPRAGLMTQLGVMTALADNYQSSPVARGKFVFTQLFCQPIGAPPANLPAAGVPPAPDPTLTTRERFAQHRNDPNCSGCHALMDPLGLAFENYDAIGRYRSTENGRPIDASGEFANGTSTVTFNGALELSRYVATNPLARRCFAEKWFTYAFGRSDVMEDGPTLDAMAETLGDGTTPIRQFLIAITQRYAFTHRPVVTAQECPR
jgi:hypothetical protein